MTKKIIAVIGATGQQGSGLVRSILADPDGEFSVRALTREPTKDSAVALKEAGAEVVRFDFDDPSSFPHALEGAYGLYVVTNFFEIFDTDKEIAQVKSIAQAASKEPSIEHIVFSTNEDTRPFFNSLKQDVPEKINGYYTNNTDGKGYSKQFFPAEKTTFFHTPMYLENFYTLGMIKDGVFCCNMGDAPLAVISCNDIGKCAYGVFCAGDEYKGKNVYITGDKMPCQQIMDTLSNVTGRKFSHLDMDRTSYANLGFPGSNFLANYFDYHKRCPEASGNRNVELSKKLNPDIQNVQEWAETHKEQLLPLALAPPQAV